MKKIIISTVVVLSIAVAGYFAVDAQQKQYKANQADLNLAKTKESQVKTERAKGKPVLSDIYIRQAKERYEADPADMDALRVITEQYWLLSKKYIELDKNSARNSYTHLIEENMNNSLQHLEELDSKMSAGWNNPEFRDKNEEIVKSLIKFSIHLSNNETLEQKWKHVWLNRNLEKWERGEKTYAVAHWIMSMYSSKHEFDPETGKQASMPQIMHWGEVMRKIGKPENYSRGQPW
jgi:hypothetical protein